MKLARVLTVAWLALPGCSSSSAESAPPDAATTDAAHTATPPTDTDAPDTPAADERAGPRTTLEFPVDEPGPFAVGYRSWEITYTPVGVHQERTLAVHVWYPADQGSTGEHPTWVGIFTDDVSVIDAPAAPPTEDRYPVHVYSHGHQAFAGSSWQITRALAGHGWVVVAPDHVGDMLGANPDSFTVAHFLERPQDVSRALDALEALPHNDPLTRADTTRVVMSGHSRGTYSVWAAVGATYNAGEIAGAMPDATPDELTAFTQGLSDPRVVAAIPMAGTYRTEWFGPTGYQAVQVPILYLSGDEDNAEASQQQYDTMTGLDFTWVELQGGCHQTFGVGLCDHLDDTTGFRTVNTYILAFSRAHVLGDLSEKTLGILDGSVPVSSAATLRHKAP